MLIAEDDPDYARDPHRRRSTARASSVWPPRAAWTRCALARKYRPHAVCLDIGLPDMLGWAVLGQLKQDPARRGTCPRSSRARTTRCPALSRGAYSYPPRSPLGVDQLDKAFEDVRTFLSNRKRRLLVVDPSGGSDGMTALLAGDDVRVSRPPASGTAALGLLAEHDFDCVVLASRTPDMDALDSSRARAACKRDSFVPFVVYVSSSLGDDDQQRLRAAAGTAS